MARTKPPVRTIHHLAVIASLEAQSNAVMMLIQVANTVLSIEGDKLSPGLRDKMREQLDATQAAMWPSDE